MSMLLITGNLTQIAQALLWQRPTEFANFDDYWKFQTDFNHIAFGESI